jgi:hypothetical protein
LPCGKHHHRPVAVDDDDPREEGTVRALELDAGRGSRRLPEPIEDRLGARRAARAATGFFEEDVADDLRYTDDGQMASEMAATSRPATAAAAPFFVASAVSTRMT